MLSSSFLDRICDRSVYLQFFKFCESVCSKSVFMECCSRPPIIFDGRSGLYGSKSREFTEVESVNRSVS